MVKVAITHHAHIATAIQDALNLLTMADLVAGKLVAVKPNETWASKDDTTAVTQPDTLRAVLRYLKQFHPKALVVTGGAGAGDTEEICEIVGLMEVVRAEGVGFFDHNRPPFTAIPLAYAPDREVEGLQQSVIVNPRVLEYDTLIAVNQLKVHETATVTLGLKNIAMSYPAADYYGHPRSSSKHQHHFFTDLHAFIVAMAQRFPIDLSITVGHPAMIGTGPIGGYTVETGLVIASRDPIACDTVGARLLGFSPQAVHHLWEAGRLGLGETEPSHMEFPGLTMQEAVSVFSQAAYGKDISLDHA